MYTDPETGEYSVTVPSGATYDVTFTSQYPGYEPVTQEVVLGDSDATQDAALPVDSSTCTAAGYRFNTAGVTENFDSGTQPDGWSVVDHIGNRPGLDLQQPRWPLQPHRRRRWLRGHGLRRVGLRREAGHLAGDPRDRHV